jgi:hypothetical protein
LYNQLRIKFTLYLLLLFAVVDIVYAQQNVPLNREWSLNVEKQNSKVSDSAVALSSIKPFIVPIQKTVKDQSRSYFVRKLSRENLLIVDDSSTRFYLTLDPLFNFEGGRDVADSSQEKLVKNTRGLLLRGAVGSKFYFESSFYENQATYAQYIDNYIAGTGLLYPGTEIVPGQGRAKPFRTNGYDFAMASGIISYSPNNHFNFQAGHGKHFIGDGYRSLLLSDNSHNYPYARITSTYKNIQYTNLYTVFTNLTDGGAKTPAYIERLFQKKVGNYQLLSLNLLKRFQLGFFQGMIWQPADTTNSQYVNFNTFNPLIFTNSIVYGLRNKNNVILGATLKIKITNSISVFGQYVIDDISRSADGNKVHHKQGYQVGVKYFDVFTIKNLLIQAEYNSVSPYTYSANNAQYSYTHFNQALAHPLGANFNEVVAFLNYRIKNFWLQYKVNYIVKGYDNGLFNYGGNVFKSDKAFDPQQNLTSTSIAQGNKTTILYNDLQFGYLVNPASNFNIVFGVTDRVISPNVFEQNSQVVYFAIRTSLANFYYDF